MKCRFLAIQPLRAVCRLCLQFNISGFETFYLSLSARNAQRFPRFSPIALWENSLSGLHFVQISVTEIFFDGTPASIRIRRFRKCITEVVRHIFPDLITVAADTRSHAADQVFRDSSVFLLHRMYHLFPHAVHGSSPAGMCETNGMVFRIYKI